MAEPAVPVVAVVAVALAWLDAVELEAADEEADAELAVELIDAAALLADVAVVSAVVGDVSPSSPAPIMFGQSNDAERNSSLTCWHVSGLSVFPIVLSSLRHVASSYRTNTALLPFGQFGNFLMAYS